jgi:hypothetical protein
MQYARLALIIFIMGEYYKYHPGVGRKWNRKACFQPDTRNEKLSLKQYLNLNRILVIPLIRKWADRTQLLGWQKRELKTVSCIQMLIKGIKSNYYIIK